MNHPLNKQGIPQSKIPYMTNSNIVKSYPVDHVCPCSSSKIYQKCCLKKDFEYGYTQEGNLVKNMKIDDMVSSLLGQKIKFMGTDLDLRTFSGVDISFIKISSTINVETSLSTPSSSSLSSSI